MSELFKHLVDTRNLGRVKSIQFGVLSPEEIRKGSVVEVKLAETYEGSDPKHEGLFDARMGVIERNVECSIDHHKRDICPGYFGHIDLAMPVYWEQFIDMVAKVLGCICIRCGTLLLDWTNPELVGAIQKRSGSSRFNYVLNLLNPQKGSVLRCGSPGGCQMVQPISYKKIAMDKMKDGVSVLSIEAIFDEGIVPEGMEDNPKWMLRADYVYNLFRKMRDEHIELLGFSPKYSRPEWWICTVLPVAPPAVRPSVHQDDNQRREDDLTCKLSDVIKYNKNLKKLKEAGADAKRIAEAYGLVQYHVATYVNNEIKGIPPSEHRSGRPLKSFRQRLKGKDGRIRANLMGKRVDFSARSVVTIEQFEIDKYGVPEKVAKNVTVPEIVTSWNQERLRGFIRNGPKVHPGAVSVVQMNRDANGIPHPRMKYLLYGDRESIVLQPGDIVNRHLMNNDIALFNRQPSLHRMSMMGHRVEVMKGNTFRLNVSAVSPYNADYDGDEMNVFVPQSLQTRVELKELAMVPTQIFSPRDGFAIIHNVLDAMTGMFRFTSGDVYMTKNELMNTLMFHNALDGKWPEPADPVRGYSGFQIMSMILPRITYYNRDVAIENGVYKGGQLTDKEMGGSPDGLVKVIGFLYGNWSAKDWIDYAQKLTNTWMMKSGLSTGITDVSFHKETIEKVRKSVDELFEKANTILEQGYAGLLNPHLKPVYYFADLESQMMHLDNIKSEKFSKDLLNDHHDVNGFMQIVKTGSKGNVDNLVQTTAIVGQQSIMARRVTYSMTNRTLPHFIRDDYGLTARGFVRNSFTSGLEPHEFFFHSIAGRVGLIDTAIKSVTYDTPIIILQDNTPLYTKIGEWIDKQMDENIENIERLPKKDQELLQLSKLVYIPTTDMNGTVSWGEVTAITRHDPGEAIYRVKTLSGRDVKVVESKSLIVWDNKMSSFTEKQTSQIKIGDYLPVTMNLCTPPSTTSTIDVTKYFNKSQYIYGSEFNKALKQYNELMSSHKRVPNGWWKENNGNTFTLPYQTVSRFQRALTRSYTGLKDGFIYPYHGSRNCGTIPEELTLDHNLGVFIGLYLAEGNSDIRSGTVKITNNQYDVRKFAMKWLETYHIRHKEEQKTNKIGGLSTSIVGYSRMLGQLLYHLVGEHSHYKYVPNVAFNAPIDFVCGLLSGYISGDGGITKTGITTSSASQKLTEGIAWLCNRIGVFGKLSVSQAKTNNIGTKNIAPAYRLTIRGQWVTKFVEKVTLIDSDKQKRLSMMKPSITHRNYQTYNDVILDPITEIIMLNVSDYPKVYDITVPSTLNFGLSNGLQVRDTADSGYMQRRLVKSMEDLAVRYDYTVRTANQTIVQFRYGEDSFDPMKLQKQKLDLLYDSDDDILKKYRLSEEDWVVFEKMIAPGIDADLNVEKDIVQKDLDSYFETRSELRFSDFPKFNDFNTFDGYRIRLPIHWARLVQKIQDDFGSAIGGPIRVLPSVFLQKRKEVEEEFERILTKKGAHILNVSMRSWISVKRVCFVERWTLPVLMEALQRIRTYFYKGLVAPGEMVGVLTAQMIGEQTTQLTLNTFHGAGQGNKSVVTSTGVPRMKEIIDLAKTIRTPIMDVTLKSPYGDSEEQAKALLTHFEYTNFENLLMESVILYEPHEIVQERVTEESEFVKLYETFAPMLGITALTRDQLSPWVLSLSIDKEGLLRRNLSMVDLRMIIQRIPDMDETLHIYYSDDNAEELTIRIRLRKGLEENDPVTFLQKLEKMILGCPVQGIEQIDRAAILKRNKVVYQPDGKPVSQFAYIIQTNGIQFHDVMKFDFVDCEKTICNDFHIVYQTLGIEAARALLIQELNTVVNDSDKVNYRHIETIIDNMTYRGVLMPINRHGLKRSPDISPFAKASYEETAEVLVNAALYAEKDNIQGVSSNILVGQIPVGGTNGFEVLFDEGFLDRTPTEISEEPPIVTSMETIPRTNVREDALYIPDLEEEEVVDQQPEFEGFLEQNPFGPSWYPDLLERLGNLDVSHSVRRPLLFRVIT